MSTLLSVPKNGTVVRPNLNSWIDDWFGRDVSSMFNTNFNAGITLPAVNIRETGEAYFVEMAVPGLKKTDFSISIDNNVLSISTELEEKSEAQNESYTRREFGYSSFKRSFTLPETVEDQKIEGKYQEGILSIHLPKKDEAKQKPTRTIKIS